MSDWSYTVQRNNWNHIEGFINAAGPRDAGGIEAFVAQTGSKYNIHVWVRNDHAHQDWRVSAMPWASGQSVGQQLEGNNFSVLGFHDGIEVDNMLVAARFD